MTTSESQPDLAGATRTAADPDDPRLPAQFGAEVFGAFLLVLGGVGTALYAGLGSVGAGSLGVALAFGLALAAGIAAVGAISGGHFNPAVTLGAAVAGRIRWAQLPVYWAAQVVGACFATLLLFLTVPATLQQAATGKAGSVRQFFSGTSNGFDLTSAFHTPLGRAGQVHVSMLTALLIETVVTAAFVGVILFVTRASNSTAVAPLAIGGTLTVLLLVATPLTNGSLNPARSLASALFSESWALKQLWVFWVGPLVGALFAGLVARVAVGFGASFAAAGLALDGTPPDGDDEAAVVTVQPKG